MLKRIAPAAALAVLLAFGPALAADQPAKPPENVMKAIKAQKDLSKFADLIASAGLEKQFEEKGANMTVFAPTNAAMGKIPSDVMKRAKAEKEGLKSLVLYHTIMGSQVFSGNISGRRASPSTGNGEMVSFDGMGKELKVNEATIVTPDLVSQNGVVQMIDTPLIPPSLKEQPKAQVEPAAEPSALPAKMAPPAGAPRSEDVAPPPAQTEEGAKAAKPSAPAPEKKSLWQRLWGK